MSERSSGRSVRALGMTCALFLCACGGETTPRKNVVLIVVDTMRAGRTSLNGYERPTTPRIEAWAERGIVFERTQAPSSWTVPSMAMLLTGRYRVGGGKTLTEESMLLSSSLSEEGYRTIGIVANPVLNDLQGFTVGYETYDLIEGDEDDTDPDHIGSWTAQTVVGKALRWLQEERDERPFLLYLHLMDPHHPYEPDDIDAFDWKSERSLERRGAYDTALASTDRGPVSDQEYDSLEHQLAAYDAEILQVDRGLGALFDYLDSSGLSKDSIVILTADHGEGLWQRPSADGWVNVGKPEGELVPDLYRGHGEQLFDELLWVPLVFRGPGVPEGLRESRPVSLIDVLPTLYFLLDLSPPTDLHGTPLFGEQAPTELGDLFSTCSRGATVTEDGRWKLHLPSERIMGRGAEPVLFDLESDPLERTPIEDPSREARLRAKIAAWTALYKEDAEALPIEKQRQLLLQMGYVGLAEELTEDMTPEEKQRLFKIEKEELEERRRAEALAGDEDG